MYSSKKVVLFLIAIVFVYLYFPIALPHGQPTTGYSMIPDAEADYLITKSVAEGGRLYQDFSILYPPGRFFLQALLFKLISPSAVVSSVLRIALSLVIFPALFFILADSIVTILLKYYKLRAPLSSILSLVLALTATTLYLMFIRSAQEIHALAGAFFLCLLWPGSFSRARAILTGICGGLILLFRLDAGIFLVLSLALTFFMQSASEKIELKKHLPSLCIGFAVIWIPTVLAIALHGSLFHFLYDIWVLGILVQPKLMSLPIPENELGLVFLSSLIFLTGSSVALFIQASHLKEQLPRIGLQSFAVFALLSYVSALGRSDEPHLWYGLVWLTILLITTAIGIVMSLYRREKISVPTLILCAVVSALFAWFTLQLKSPGFFILGSLLLCALARRKHIQVISLLIAVVIVSLCVFHSVSYLRLKFSLPKPPPRSAFTPSWVTSEGKEIGGILMQDSSQQILDKIRVDVPRTEQYLFIFPTNVLLAEYMGLKSPTRYSILGAERTDRTEEEIIADLDRTKTKYFLIFDQKARDRNGKLWDWIQQNTKVINEYRFPPDFEIAHLRLRNQ